MKKPKEVVEEMFSFAEKYGVTILDIFEVVLFALGGAESD